MLESLSVDPSTTHHLHRIDRLTGCGNLLGFLDWLTAKTDAGSFAPGSLAALDVNRFSALNLARGHEHGDAALRWVALVLADETSAPAFRTGGDEFALALDGADFAGHLALAERLFTRLNREADRVGLGQPALSIAVVHYSAGTASSPAQVLEHLGAAVAGVQQRPDRPPMAFRADELRPLPDARDLWDHVIRRMVALGALLDESQHLALTDPLTGLPNVRAAGQRLEAALAGAAPLAVLLLDGDNLRQYNELGGYAAGDKMIQDLTAALHAQLRPGDFLARWRVGDEFLVLLPDTGLDGALAVGERLCRAVREASQAWLCPISVSAGVAVRPQHGTTQADLLAAAEAAKDEAKAQGKDRVIAASF